MSESKKKIKKEIKKLAEEVKVSEKPKKTKTK